MAHLSDYYRFFSECDEFKLQKFERFKNLLLENEDIEVSAAQSAITILTAQKYSDARDDINFAKRETLDKLIPTVGTVRQMVWDPPCLIEGTKIDYKTIKVAEGVAEADTLADVIPFKNRLREEIDANRAIYRDRLAQIKSIEKEMLGGKSEESVFEACCERDNESFSAFEAWIYGNAEQNA